MELKARHAYGLGAIVIGVAAIVFGAISWLLNSKIDTTVQAAFAIGLVGIALFAALEINLLTQVLRSRQARYGAETLVMVVAFLGVVGLLNFILTRDQFKKRWDWTETKENTLAPETTKLLSELNEPIKVYAFFSGSAFNNETAQELLDNYKAIGGDNFSYEFVDPDARPTLARAHGYTTDGTLVVERGDQREPVTGVSESGLTNAIIRLNNPTKRIIYFLGGHGERSIDDTSENGISNIRADLEAINYEVRSLAVITETLPSDASAIVIAGPQFPYTETETTLIGSYLAGGGKAIVMIDPSVFTEGGQGTPDPLADYLSENWGLTLRDDVILDFSLYVPDYGPLVPVIAQYGFSPITQDPQEQNKGAFFPYTRSIAVADAGSVPEGVVAVSIAQTGPNAWGETSVESLNANNPVFDEGEAASADGLSVAATAENTASGTRLVIFSSSSFAINVFDQQFGDRIANSTLLLNAIKWVATDEALLNLTPKETVSRSLGVITSRDQVIVFLLSCILPPFLVIVGAVGMWWSRRKNA